MIKSVAENVCTDKYIFFKEKHTMKKKILVALLIAGCMAFAPSAAYAEAEEAAEVSEETGDTAEASESTGDSDAAESAELSDDLYSFQVSIGGTVYQLPMAFDELEAQGWTISKSDDPEDMVPSNSYTYVRFNKGENTITADVINFAINEMPVKQCLIGSIEVDANYDFNAESTPVLLPKGIEVGKSNLDDIKAAYGEPSDSYEGDSYVKVTYERDIYERIEMYVYKEENALLELDLRNFTEPEDFEKGEVSTEVPDIVTAYQAPQEPGEDFLSPVVEYFGDLYQLPAPVSAFLENGWTMKDVSEDAYVAGRDIDFIDMMKENQTVHFSVYNKTQNATAIENCFVQELSFGSYDPEVIAMKLSGDVTLGAKKDDLIALAEEKGYLYEENGDYLRFYANKDDQYDKYVDFWFNTDESETDVASISYRNEIVAD